MASCRIEHRGQLLTQEEFNSKLGDIINGMEMDDIDSVFNSMLSDKLARFASNYDMDEDGLIAGDLSEIKDAVAKARMNDVVDVISDDDGFYLNVKGHGIYSPGEEVNEVTDIPVEGVADAIAMNFLNEVGATIEFPEKVEHDAVAKVNLLDKIVSVVESKRGMDTLTEEAVHIMIAMMRGSVPYQRMMNAISTFEIYDQVNERYGSLENYNPLKIKEEAVVQFVTGLVVSDPTSSLARTWWQQILDYLRDFFKPAAVAEFRRAAQKFIQADVKGLSNEHIKEGEVFYQKIEPNEEAQKHVTDYFEEMNKMGMRIKENERYEKPKNGEYVEVRFRASDIVKKLGEYIYKGAEHSPELREKYTTKGTIIHYYNYLIMDTLMKNKGKIHNEHHMEIEKKVYDYLSKQPTFKNFPDRKYYTMTFSQFHQLARGVQSIYNSIHNKDKNAKIFLEQKVYDPKSGRDDIAGTIDVAVAYSDGTIGIYDYKAIRLGEKKINVKEGGMYWKPNDDKRQMYDLQLSIYKEILKNGIGLKDYHFRESRIVPINTQINFRKNRTTEFEKIEMLAIDPVHDITKEAKEDTRSYIKHLAVGREYVTGDESFNLFLQRIYDVRDQMRKDIRSAKGDARSKLKARIDSLNGVIDSLLVDGNAMIVLDDIEAIITDIDKDLQNFAMSKVLEYKGLLEIYSDLNDALRKTYKDIEGKDKKTKAFKEKMSNNLRKANDSIDEYLQILHQKILDFGQKKLMDENRDIRDGGKARDLLGGYFLGIGDWNNPVVETIARILAEERERTRLVMLKERMKINGVDDKLREWGSKNGYSAKSVYTLLYNTKTGNLFSRFKPEFWEKKKEIVKTGKQKLYAKEDYKKELTWLSDHFEFNEEAWQKWYDTKRAMYEADKTLSKKKIDEYMSNDLDRFNPNINDGAWFLGDSNPYIRPKKALEEIQGEFISKEWAFINKKGNEPLREYYDMYVEYNRQMAQIFGWENIKENFVANIRASTLERLTSVGPLKAVSLYESFLDSLEVREYDETFGVVDKNGAMRRIPMVFVDPLKGKISSNERIAIENEVAKEFNRGTGDFEEEVNTRIARRQYEKGVDAKSADLTRNLIMMLEAATDYKHKDNIEDEILALREIMTFKEHQPIPLDNHGKPIKNWITNQMTKYMGADPDSLNSLDKLINYHLYGQRLQGRDWTVDIGDRTYSGSKLIQLGHSYLTIKSLGLNPILAGASYFNAVINMKIMRKKGKYFSERSWNEAMKDFTGGDEKVLAAIYFMEPKSRSNNYEEALKKSAYAGVKAFNIRNILGLHRGFINKRGSKKYGIDNPVFGDDNIDNSILIAMMKHWVIGKDGKVYSPTDEFRKPPEEGLPTVFDSFKIDEEGNMSIEGLEHSEFTHFRRMVIKAQSRVKGSMGEDQINQGNLHITGQILQKFRNWMPGLIMEKLSPFRYDPILRSFEEGHLRTAVSNILPVSKRKLADLGIIELQQEAASTMIATLLDATIKSIKPLVSLLWESLTFGYLGKAKVNKEKAEYYRLKFINANPHLDTKSITLEAFIEFRKRQLRAAAMEVRYLMYISGLLVGILAMAGWDDEDDNMWAYNVYKLAKRTGLELSFFFSFNSVNEIVKSPVPLMRVLTDFGRMAHNGIIETAEFTGFKKEDARDRSPFGYYFLKNLPGANQALMLTGYFDQTQTKSTFAQLFSESILFQEYNLSR